MSKDVGDRSQPKKIGPFAIEKRDGQWEVYRVLYSIYEGREPEYQSLDAYPLKRLAIEWCRANYCRHCGQEK